MTAIIKRFEIEAFVDDEKKPTCCFHIAEGTCKFLGSKNFGQRLVCLYSLTPVYRDDNGLRLARPHKNCPVWSSYE